MVPPCILRPWLLTDSASKNIQCRLRVFLEGRSHFLLPQLCPLPRKHEGMAQHRRDKSSGQDWAFHLHLMDKGHCGGQSRAHVSQSRQMIWKWSKSMSNWKPLAQQGRYYLQSVYNTVLTSVPHLCLSVTLMNVVTVGGEKKPVLWFHLNIKWNLKWMKYCSSGFCSL